MTTQIRVGLFAATWCLLVAGCAQFRAALTPAAEPGHAVGVVYHDVNGNAQREPDEPGLARVGVSNGRDVVLTDARGGWRLPYSDDTIFFVIKPSGWSPPLNEQNLPQFYYIHKPAGSPPLRYPGVTPTGPLPQSIDFPLRPQTEPDQFDAIVFGDTQPRNQKELEYIGHDVVEELVGTRAMFGVTLGDLVFDDLSMFPDLNRTIALIGIPWYNVIGNHDINFDAATDEHSDETFESVYGPPYYSFDYGKVHFLVLDDVRWFAPEEDSPGGYAPGLDEKQLEFIRNDLALVPPERMLVLFMHIPLSLRWIESEREQLYRIIEQRPLTLSFAAHTHTQAHTFITAKNGWRGRRPHHHVINVTVSGSWWRGLPDDRGIPMALMADGAPNGYSIVSFNGSGYKIRYKAAGRPANYQMNIHAPEQVESARTGDAELLVNVFAGSDRSVVRYRVGADGVWLPMVKSPRPDPYFEKLKRAERERQPSPGYLNLPRAQPSLHLWSARLPQNLPIGTHLIEVSTTDMFGQTHRGYRIIHVR